MKRRPQLWVFAGPNGAGKSTIVARFRVEERMALVNPDNIARLLVPVVDGSKTATLLKAGRLAAIQRRVLLAHRLSFAMETTLTGHSELRVMSDPRSANYKVTLVYVGLTDALTSLARVRERVARGGHDVETSIIMRRYAKSMANPPSAIQLADRAFILDNTGPRHRLLVTIDDGQARHSSLHMPALAGDQLSKMTR